MRKTTVVALPLLLVLLAFAFTREEAPPVSRAYQSEDEPVVLNFALNKINFEEVELVLAGRVIPQGSSAEGAPRVLHKQQEEDVFLQFEVSLDLSLAKGVSTVVTLAGVSDESEVEGDVMPDNLPNFPFLYDEQEQPVLNFPFAHEIVHGKDGNGDLYMHMTYVGRTVPLISTLVVAEPMTMPSVMSEFFDMQEHMQFQPGTYDRDPQTQGFWIPMRLVELTDLSLNKTCEASDDGTGSFHLILSNNGPGNATSVAVQDWLPAVDITGWSGDGSFDSGTGLWTLGDVMTNTTKILWIDFTATASGYYENHAEVISVDQPDPDSTPDDGSGDDYAECSFSIAPTIDLSLEKTCEASDNGTGSFHLALSNAGPDEATGVEVTDWFPEGLTVTGSSGDGSFDTGSGLWDVGTVGTASTVERWINFTFDPDATAHYVNHAEVTEVNEGDADSAPDDGEGDDYDECGFFVFTDDRGVVPDFVPEQGASGVTDRGRRFMADLRVTKEVDVETAAATTNVEYTITVTDTGPYSTSGVSVKDVLPECLTFVSASADRGSYDATTGLWTIGPVKVGETLELTLVAKVGADCPETVTNTASVASTTLPDPPRLPDDPDAPLDDPFETPATVLNNTSSVSFSVEASGRALDGTTFALGANYPNPFNPTTTVPFSLAEAGPVSIKVYDLLGREVAVLVDGTMVAGAHEVTFDARALSTGVYLIRMEAAGTVQTQYVTLTK